jgi:hypothetical protein
MFALLRPRTGALRSLRAVRENLTTNQIPKSPINQTPTFTVKCGGDQKRSMPMVFSQEKSHSNPTGIIADATAAHRNSAEVTGQFAALFATNSPETDLFAGGFIFPTLPAV